MHNILTNFRKFHDIFKDLFQGEIIGSGNFQKYPKAPKMTDLQIAALSLWMEALSIDSENLLWFKLKTEYETLFPKLTDISYLSWQPFRSIT